MRRNNLLRAAALLCIADSLSPLSFAQGGSGAAGAVYGGGVPQYIVPEDLLAYGVRGAGFQRSESLPDDMDLEATVFPMTKKLLLSWHDHTTGESLNQTLALSYTPTAICRGNGFAELFVGGTATNGFTHIMRYRFDKPDFQSPGNPVDPGFVVNQAFVADLSPGMRNVANLTKNRVGVNRLFVQFYDSKDVYDFSVPSGSISKLVSKNAGATFQIQGIDHRFDFVYSRDHVAHGYSYFLGALSVSNVGYDKTIIMADGDRNGSIDSVAEVDSASWDALGFGNPAFYNDD